MSINIDIRAKDLLIAQEIIKSLPEDIKVFVFGSRAKGTNKRASDLDLAIDAGRKLTKKELSNLENAFDESDIPYKVDIVDMQNISDSFKKIIEETKIPFPRN